MKIQNEERFVRSSGLKSTNAFQISTSKDMFNVLSNQMYSDKVTAVIRELTCNARDAHTAAGKEDTPYEVHLPTVLEPHFHVRDEGIGLCFEDIMVLYTTYGVSLKNETNDMIGGLGLGSKCGFAYADQYTVEGRWNGEKYLFSCYVDVKGEPQISHLNTTPTSEPNGLTITVPVDINDIREFTDKATILFEYYVPKPKCNVVLEYPEKKTLLKGKGWEVYSIWSEVGVMRRGRSRRNYATAIQGQLCYPILSDKLTGADDKCLNLLKSVSLDIWFNIGDLEVASNREGLSYSPYTIRNIIDKLAEVYKNIVDVSANDVSSARSLWYASIKGEELFDIFKYNNSLKKDILGSVCYKGKPIHVDRIKMDCDTLDSIWTGKFTYVPHKSSTNVCFKFRDIEKYGNWHISTLKHYVFYYHNTDNKKHKLPSTIQKHLDGKEAQVILLESSQSELKRVLEYLGNPDYIDTSTLPVPEAVKKGSKAYKKASVKLCNTAYNHWYNSVEHDMSSGGVYVKLLRGSPAERNEYDIRDQIKFLRKELGDKTDIYGIPGTYHKALDKHSDVWLSLDQHYEKLCKKERLSIGNKTEVKKYLELSRVYGSMDNSLKNFLTIFNDGSTIKFKYNVLNSSLKDYKEYIKLNIKFTKKNNSIHNLFKTYVDSVAVDNYVDNHNKEINKVWEKHPILRDGLNTYRAQGLKAMRPDLETILEDWSNT